MCVCGVFVWQKSICWSFVFRECCCIFATCLLKPCLTYFVSQFFFHLDQIFPCNWIKREHKKSGNRILLCCSFRLLLILSKGKQNEVVFANTETLCRGLSGFSFLSFVFNTRWDYIEVVSHITYRKMWIYWSNTTLHRYTNTGRTIDELVALTPVYLSSLLIWSVFLF